MRTRTSTVQLPRTPPKPPGIATHGRWLGTAATGLVLALAGLLAYGNALPNDFVIDDNQAIVADSRVHQGRLGALLTQPYWEDPQADVLYRPLISASFGLNWACSPHPWTFRLPNILLHIGVAWTILALGRDLTGSRWAGLIAALLFVAHPVHTQVLNSVVGRADVAVALLGLNAVRMFVRHRDGLHAMSWWRPVAATLLFAAALGCKENGIVFPAIVLLFDLYRPAGRAIGRWVYWRRRLLRCYLPMALVVIAYLGVRGAVLGRLTKPTGEIALLDNFLAHAVEVAQPGDSAFLVRWGTPVALLGQGLHLLIWPRDLCWDYSFASIEPVRQWSDGRLAFGLATLLAAGVGMAWSWRRGRRAGVALGLGLIAWSITSNTFVLIGTTFAERLLYLPSVGLFLLVGIFLAAAAEQWPARIAGGRSSMRRAVLAGIVLLVTVGPALAAECWRTRARSRDWRNEAVLHAADLRVNPRSARLWHAQAVEAYNRGEFAEALRCADRAAEICPSFGEAWRISGIARWRMGENTAALSNLEQSFRLGGLRSENAAIAAADALKREGRYAAALGLLQEHLQVNPQSAGAANNLAWYLLTAEPEQLRDPQAALHYAQMAHGLQPHAGDVLDTYVAVLEALDRRPEARQLLEEAWPGLPAEDPFRESLARKLEELRR